MRHVSVIMGICYLVSWSAFAADTPPVRNSPESILSYMNLKKYLSERFKLPEANIGLPAHAIPSSDCEVSIEDTTGRPGELDRVSILVIKGEQEMRAGSYLGNASEIIETRYGWRFNNYTEDCEEEGCDGNWYVEDSIFVGPKLLTVSYTAPYSHRVTSISCILL